MFEARIRLIIEARQKGIDASDHFFQIRRTGKRPETAEAFRQIVEFDPGWIQARYHYGIALIRIQQHGEALGCFRLCASAHPKWISALYHLGLCHLKQGDEGIALSIFEDVLKLDYRDDVEEYSKTFETLGDHQFVMARRRKDLEGRELLIEELRQRCRADIARHGRQPWSLLYLGAAAFHAGRIDEALELLEEAGTLADPHTMNRPFLFRSAYGCYSIRTPGSIEAALGGAGRVSAPAIRLEAPTNAPLVMLIGCDEGYFNRFSSSFLATLFETNDRLTVHFHIIGDEQAIAAQRQRLAAELRSDRDIKIAFSFEGRPAHGNKTYFALSRFIVAPQLLRHYGCDLVIGDIDAAVIGNLHEVKAFVGDGDAGVDTSYSTETFRKFPWNAMSGCYLFLRATEHGVAYAEAVSVMMRESFDPSSPKTWWLDQSILYCVTHFMRGREPAFEPVSLIPDAAPKPFLYSVPGESKDEFSASLRRDVASGAFAQAHLATA